MDQRRWKALEIWLLSLSSGHDSEQKQATRGNHILQGGTYTDASEMEEPIPSNVSRLLQ
jgi:hypothetical protein